jgi:CRP-like cAMP-binding protein
VAKKTQARADEDCEAPRLFGALGSPLEGIVTGKALKAGETLITQGEPSDTLCLVDSGSLAVHLDTAEGRLELGTTARCGWVGEMGMLVPGVASATVVARTQTRVVPISHGRYLDLLKREPRAMGTALLNIARDLARRLRRASEAELGPDAQGHLRLLPHFQALAGTDRGTVPSADMPKIARERQRPRVDDGALLWTLDHLGLFRSDDAAEQAHLAALRKAVADLAPTGLSVQTCLHEEAITEPGMRADGVFVVLAGHVRIRAGDAGSPLHVDRELGPGAVFGHQAFFDDHRRSASVSSVGASVLAVFWPAAVDEILRQAVAGTPTWLPILDWFARQLTLDARALNDRLYGLLSERKPRRRK